MSREPALGQIGDRFKIYELTAKDSEWGAAIGMIANYFYSPLWTKVYPNNGTALTYSTFKVSTPLIPSIAPSGMCLGVFDTEYKFKRVESEATGGKLYWDLQNLDKTRKDMEDEMDFPLVHISLSFDGGDPPPEAVMEKLFVAMPLWAWFEGEFAKQTESKDSNSTGTLMDIPPEKILKRCGTFTRGDYMHSGLMRACSKFLMFRARDKGYQAIDIDAAHPSVSQTWMNPPSPFKAKLIGTLRPEEYANRPGDMEQQFARSEASIDRIRVYLEKDSEGNMTT